jgi:hypothetical protein
MQKKYNQVVLLEDLQDSDDPYVREQARQSTGLSMSERLIDLNELLRNHRILVNTLQSALEEAGSHQTARVSFHSSFSETLPIGARAMVRLVLPGDESSSCHY